MAYPNEGSYVERWSPIAGFEGSYDVSDRGRVRSWRPWNGHAIPRLLKSSPASHGYAQVILYDADRRVGRTVHSLVAEAFLGDRPDWAEEVRHLDGDRTNNTVANLAYGTRLDNAQDRRRHGTHVNTRKTHCSHGHELSGDNVRWRADRRGRECRACQREWARAHSERRKGVLG